jgi:hypothetical protein
MNTKTDRARELIRLEQRKAAMELFDKPLHFAGRPDGDDLFIASVTRDGMVELEGWSGFFAPHLFVVTQPISAQESE